MKIREGSFPLQNHEIIQAIEKLYQEIFPQFFTDREIQSFKDSNVLSIPDSLSEVGTLKGAFQAIASLHTIIILLEKRCKSPEQAELFERNAKILNELGIFFPFEYRHFFEHDDEPIQLSPLLLDSKAANSYLI